MAELKHFVRIANTDLEGKKNIGYALTKIKGVSYNFASVICNVLNIEPIKKAGALTDDEIKKIDLLLKAPKEIPPWLYNRKKDFETGENKHLITSNLKLFKEFDIKRSKKIKSYVGMRHASGLPVRGQRTRSNFRKGTAVGVIKKKLVQAPAKTEKSKKKDKK